MKYYAIPEALTFLAEEYGADKMPTSQETLRRAIRVGELQVQEEGDPGRKGYTISEADLRAYARKRLARIERRSLPCVRPVGNGLGDTRPVVQQEQELRQFHELYVRFLGKELTEQEYIMALYGEKARWEARLRDKKEQLINLTSMLESLKNEIEGCETNIEEFQKGISKALF